MAHYGFTVEMRKYVRTGSSEEDSKVEPGITVSVMGIMVILNKKLLINFLLNTI
jgi:hypothetical protein